MYTVSYASGPKPFTVRYCENHCHQIIAHMYTSTKLISVYHRRIEACIQWPHELAVKSLITAGMASDVLFRIIVISTAGS